MSQKGMVDESTGAFTPTGDWTANGHFDKATPEDLSAQGFDFDKAENNDEVTPTKDTMNNIPAVKFIYKDKRSAGTPSDHGPEDIQKSVTRTINFVDGKTGQPMSNMQAEIQHVDFERSSTKDEATGKWTYGDWHLAGSNAQSGSFSDYEPKAVDGYEQPAAVAAEGNVKANTANSSVTVTYQHKSSAGTPSDHGPEDVQKSVTRTINFVDGTTGQPMPNMQPEVQQVNFERSATKDDATGNWTYGDWHVAGSDATSGSFAGYEPKTVDGYEQPEGVAAEANVTAQTANASETVTY
ncbi:hypothetical protein NFX39_00770 [Fructobacillus sp. W13]|uniref:Mub B2-like domain-containing protein n=1 Tax=Fructobacillus apis TaxID=2935017 RepID=A0ABT0ZNP7_9LACO|nr:hypothetical protein [Fructobacillus apis]MCO0831627.1 hypothetical protein [Fructobacillus apis]